MKAFFLLVVLSLALVFAGCQTEDKVNLEAECSTDADCAAAGCSGQVCTTAEEAPMIITTCEYREEYSCLEQTNCGCVEGQCSWAQTEDYLSCLENLKS
ncbi:hypothetical protein CMO88_00700 [Candidatus Woesearchaeota archaeon]|nr:hypothetical protein [Candidatus Woesearchaeota archaeon]|tara:strand:- start:650 stop:946 length:297 start_codon:yes stop_codon:yes gene_type:complete